MVFNGFCCNTQLFETWAEQFLIRELKLGQFIIMDNATFHKSQKIKELIESVGCELIFLPPYSPEKQRLANFNALYDSLVSFFNYTISKRISGRVQDGVLAC